MCAIAGVIGVRPDQQVERKMFSTMAHRGPDGCGSYHNGDCTLLHTRLAIIDIDGGRQPMCLQWGQERYVITYNGELYNTEDIRKKLLALGHSFSGHSDTEVLLHGYAQWGEAVLEELNGIYAFAVWEEKNQRLFLARDRIGVKPLFYTHVGTDLIFASEIKTLLAHKEATAKIDAEGIAELLLLGPGRSPGSGVFRGMKEIEPGCCGYYAKGRLQIRRYWKLTDREHRESFEETAEVVRELVMDAICRQLVSDVPIGTFLSGGLDSSLISAICAERITGQGGTLPTFSVDYLNNDRYFRPGKFQPNSDPAYIDIMCRAIESEHHWTVLDPEELIGCLEDATYARDLPGMADVDFSLLAFCKQIREHVKVALSGECADEIFGGYPWYRDPEIRSKDGFPWAQNTAQRVGILNPGVLGSLDPFDYVQDRYRQTVSQSDILPGQDALERRMKEMVNLNFRWFMQTLLDRKDRMSMWWGLEVRVPFCDHRIAEYLYGVPWEFKDYNGKEKGLLRYAVQGILPDEILWRKKSPYPKTFDPRYTTLLEDRINRLLSDSSAPIWQLLDKVCVAEQLRGEHPWPWYGQLMRRPQTMAYLLQIDFWLRHYHVSIV